MVLPSWSVRDQMARESPTKRQYLLLESNPAMYGGLGARKVYSMPLIPKYFQGRDEYLLADSGKGKQTHAVFGVVHPDPSNPFEPLKGGPGIQLYGFAEVEYAPNLDTVLPDFPADSPGAHNLFRVLSVHE